MASASMPQPTVVSEAPRANTPQLVSTTAVPRPHVDAVGELNGTIYAGGRFDRVAPAGASQPSLSRMNIFAFDAATGLISESFAPDLNGNVWAVEAVPGAVYVGGEFTTVDGVTKAGIAKLDPLTGKLDTMFRAPFKGRVNEIRMLDSAPTPRLLVGGSGYKKLAALDPAKGTDTGFIDLLIADAIPGAWGGVSVYNFAVSPDASQLVATGNFQTVNGQRRTRLFVVDLAGTEATLDPWYYPGFDKPCSSTSSRRIAYLSGVDYSPNGAFFTVAATGQVPLYKADIWPAGSAKYHTVCDAAGRFSLADDQRPVWINYTGGDSVWAVADTGAAVYVQGHFQWLDNPNGLASQCPAGETCASRKGIGAISPGTGKALAWNPGKPASQGGKDLFVTADGLWVGSDSVNFNGQPHRGIAFAPLAP
ncbi:MAG: hypothetical protein H0V49_01395 [Nocardioidaceae bacterium]|nr:hypothetical protein [Nocardioidaceae bacterium]